MMSVQEARPIGLVGMADSAHRQWANKAMWGRDAKAEMRSRVSMVKSDQRCTCAAAISLI